MATSCRRIVALLAIALAVGDLSAAVLRVRELLLVGDSVTERSARTVDGGAIYQTDAPPPVNGFIFTHWSVSTEQSVVARDAWGRATERASFKVYEDTEVVAHYMSESIDDDADGVPDALELYWYGNLSCDASSDTDQDGLGLLDELRRDQNPLFADEPESGRILVYERSDILYNPNGYAPYVIRSEPEGALFPTRHVYASPGDCVVTESYAPEDSRFSYWTLNGVRAEDVWGVASNQVAFSATDRAYTECVAHAVEDEIRRQAFYWYGREASADSDIDGDGYTFEEELAKGLSPVFRDEVESGWVLDIRSDDVRYNPKGYVPYTIRSEPEGALFETVIDWRLPGEKIATPTLNPHSSSFAYWTMDGARQKDEWGVAIDSLTFDAQSNEVAVVAVAADDEWERLSLYWYGDRTHGPDSDSDNDGVPFRDELAMGLNPVFADEIDGSRVLSFLSDKVEVSLQAYERIGGVIVDGEFVPLFDDGAGDTEVQKPFGNAAIRPIVADLNGDGLFDVVVEKIDDGSRVVYLNCGSKAIPEFRTDEWRSVWADIVETAQLKSVDGLLLDVEPVRALSFTRAGENLLASDDAGRIWFYRSEGEGFVLQHKVWGGTYAGFAEGLRIAAVDWEDDGDWDCLCGTADGRLLLLRNPKVGRPSNLRVRAGVDNALLEWDPNQQSRVRGYRVYRAMASQSVAETAQVGEVVAEPALPRHRDYPQTITDYDYRISSLSRHYTAGNSEPKITESALTEPVRAELGKVVLRWNDASGFSGDEIAVGLSIENSLAVSGTGLVFRIGYDASTLSPVKALPSGLSSGIGLTDEYHDGVWTVSASGGELAAGAGTVFSLVFATSRTNETLQTEVRLDSAELKSVGGAAIPAVMPTRSATVKMLPYIEPEPVRAAVSITESVRVKAGERFAVDVNVSGEGVDSATLTYDYVFDEGKLARDGNCFVAKEVSTAVSTVITVTNISVEATSDSPVLIESVGVCVVVIEPTTGGGTGGGDDEDDDEDIHRGDDGGIEDWGDEPGKDDARYRFGFKSSHVDLGSVNGDTGDVVEMPVGIRVTLSIPNLLGTTTIDVKRWAFTVKYDERLLCPVGVASEAGEYSWSATNGVMTVVGVAGIVELGRPLSETKHPLRLRFMVMEQYAEHLATVGFGVVQARTVDGKRIYSPVRTSGSVLISFVRPNDDPSIVTPYGRGDINGDGKLTKSDLQLMARLMNGGPNKKWTDNQLQAGDYNQDQTLDEDDYKLMKDDFRSKGIVNGGEKVGAL